MKIKNSTALYIGCFIGIMIKLHCMAYVDYLEYTNGNHNSYCDIVYISVDCESPEAHPFIVMIVLYTLVGVIDAILLILCFSKVVNLTHKLISRTIDEEEPIPDNPKTAE